MKDTRYILRSSWLCHRKPKWGATFSIPKVVSVRICAWMQGAWLTKEALVGHDEGRVCGLWSIGELMTGIPVGPIWVPSESHGNGNCGAKFLEYKWEWEWSHREWKGMGILLLQKFPHHLIRVKFNNLQIESTKQWHCQAITLSAFCIVCRPISSTKSQRACYARLLTKCTCILIIFLFIYADMLTLCSLYLVSFGNSNREWMGIGSGV